MNSKGYDIESKTRVVTWDIRIVGENPEGKIVEGLRPRLKFCFTFWVGGKD